MECQEVFESSTAMDLSMCSSCNDCVLQLSDNAEEIVNPGDDLLKDLDIYLEDINDRLTISRMVSDSVIKGMICAVEQEAAEKIAQKDLELARLNAMLQAYRIGADVNAPANDSVIIQKPKERIHELKFSQHESVQESLDNLKLAAKEQLKKLKKEFDRIKGSTSIRRKGSGSELLGLSGILQEEVPDKWIDADRTLDALRTTLDAVCKQAEDMVHFSKSSLIEWQQERNFRAEVEEMVVRNCIRSLQEDFEQRLWDQNAVSYGYENANLFRKIKEISSLRQELDAISKSLSVSESGQLISHGSLESRNASASHVSSTTSLWEGNGKHDNSIIGMPENLDLAQLKHMSKEELANYFKIELTKMKRHHESEVQKMTEKYFTIKREYLKESGSSLFVKKDKEFDMLRKKIPEVVIKLDDILVESEKLPTFCHNSDNLGNLRGRLESLQSENRQLRDSLLDKKKEIKSLSSQVSDVAERLLEHTLGQANLLTINANLKCAIEDSQIEAHISEDLYQFLLMGLLGQIKSYADYDMERDIMKEIYEVIFEEVAQNAVSTNKMEIEDSDIESIIMQGLCGVIYRGALTEADEKINSLNLKYISENEARVSLETEALEKDKELRFNTMEKEKLEQQLLLLGDIINEREKLVQEGAYALAKEEEKYALASQELDDLRVQTSEQQISISRINSELQVIKDNLVEAMEKIESDKVEICDLTERLELTTKKLCQATEEKTMLHTVFQEKQNTVLLLEAREREYKEQMDSIILVVNGLSRAVTNFECRAAEDINKISLRLEISNSQLSALIPRANKLRRIGLLYKQRLERRSSDLQKAEAEVDLLGDEVDTLLGLLEKIYIALDHYSPILQHYPGIIEILKLVRRELSGESIKPV